MSDCAANYNNGCGCENNSCNLIFLILLLNCLGGSNCIGNLGGNTNSCDIIWILLILSCLGNNNNFGGCGCNTNTCGCGC